MSTPALRPAPTAERWHGAPFVRQVTILTRRQLYAMVHDPGLVVFGLIQPCVLLFLFTQIFSNIIQTSVLPAGTSYLDFLMPAVLVNHVVQSSTQSGVGLVEDLDNGIVSRLRSLPIRPVSMLLARSLADLVRNVVQIVLLLLIALALMGYAPQGGLSGILVSCALTLFLCWSLSWIFLAIAASTRSAETMNSISVLAVLPLMFLSSGFVPLQALSPWLAAIAGVNPLTYVIEASRSLAIGSDPGDLVTIALFTCLVLAAVGIAGAVRGFRKPVLT